MTQKKSRSKAKKQVSRTKKSAQPAPTVNEDLAAQQILAQTVVDTVMEQQNKIKELEAERKRLEEELSAQKNAESAPQVLAEPQPASSKEILDYLENQILPRARQQSFSGAVPVLKGGKFEIRQISNVQQLEELIEEIKRGESQMAAATLPTTNLPQTSGFLDKLKKLVGG